MCVVCFQQTKVIWRANGECFGYPDLFQDHKGAPLMTVERPDLDEQRRQLAAEREKNGSAINSGTRSKGKRNEQK